MQLARGRGAGAPPTHTIELMDPRPHFEVPRAANPRYTARPAAAHFLHSKLRP